MHYTTEQSFDYVVPKHERRAMVRDTANFGPECVDKALWWVTPRRPFRLFSCEIRLAPRPKPKCRLVLALGIGARFPGLAFSIDRRGADAEHLGGFWDAAAAGLDGAFDGLFFDLPELQAGE